MSRIARAAAALAALLLQAAAFAQSSPFTSATRYDSMGRVTGTIAPDPDGAGPLRHAAVRNTYDGAGRLTKTQQGELSAWQSESVAPSAWTGFTIQRVVVTTYDAMGRKSLDVLSQSGTVRGVTQYGYDAAGRLECTAVRMNPALWPNSAGAGGSLPASACTPGTQGNDGADRISRNVYDVAGQRLQLRVGVGTAEEGAQASWAYNANGQVTVLIDGNGNRAELGYDGHGRQDRWTFPSPARPSAFDDSTQATALATAGAANAADYEEYGYDPNGNRTSLRKRDGSELTYQYDALNRMTVKVVPERADLTSWQTRDVHYGYDLRGLMTAARFDSPSGVGVTTAYDGFGRIASTTSTMGGETRTLSYQYDRNGNRTRLEQPNGSFWTYQYDGLNRATAILEQGTSEVIALAYNARGSLATRDNPATTHASGSTFGYDHVGRLASLAHDLGGTTGDVSFTYAHNPASQVRQVTRDNDAYAWTGHYGVTRGYATNGLNQYTAAGPATFAYDANGNLTSDGTNAYLYDVENRLVGAPAGIVISYDPLGRLWQIAGASWGTRQFLYDGDALVAIYNVGDVVKHRYVHGPGADVPLIWYEEGGSSTVRRYLFADHQGSIVQVAWSGGSPWAINAYDEYGIPQSTNVGRFQYTGQVWLPEIGMYHYKARIYSPTLGRFLQTDPIGYEDQFNLYAYVANDPVNRVDPLGLDNCKVMNPDGTLEDISGCIGDPNAPPVTPEQQQEVEDVATIVVTARQRTGSADPEEMNLGTLVFMPGEYGFRVDGDEITHVPFTTSCLTGEVQVGQFNTSQFSGSRTGGHTHGTDQMSGLGDDDAHMARMISSGIAVQADRHGVRTVDRISGSYRAIRHGNSTWGDRGASGTRALVRQWNTPQENGSGLQGDTPTHSCPSQ